MDELKPIIAKNIVSLRKSAALTQGELAEKLNYSDKAISKWERGDSVPDVAVLKKIADLFNVTVDYLLISDHSTAEVPKYDQHTNRNHLVISLLSVMVVWLVATIVFTTVGMFPNDTPRFLWVIFVYALPVSAVVLLVFNSIWGNRKWNYALVSMLVWSALLVFYTTLSLMNNLTSNTWLLFLVGCPAQVIIILWSRLKIHRKKKSE